MNWGLKGGFQLMQILGLLGMYFDAVVVEVEKCLLFFRVALAILWVGSNKMTSSFCLQLLEVPTSPDVRSMLSLSPKKNFLTGCHLFHHITFIIVIVGVNLTIIEPPSPLFCKYRTHAIITRGLYTFYPLLEVQKRFFKGSFFLKFWPYVWLVFKSSF